MMNKGGLYFHIPFCLRKCLYCDFCSYTDKKTADMEAYTEALVREMRQRKDTVKGVTFDSVFLGGGTPTLLPTTCIEKILSTANTCFSVSADAEITMEANPATADKAYLQTLLSLGVNRLSVGVQSTNDGELFALGRLHNAREALDFLKNAREAGFSNINVDLMYGIPDQTLETAKKTLSDVLAFSPEHISAYSLMLEEGTPLYQKRDFLTFPKEEDETAIDGMLRFTLRDHGYQHYEISNYAQKGKESRHNLHYWHSDSYCGFGVAAYSFVDGVRFGNTEDFSAYLSSPDAAKMESEVLNEKDLSYEWIMLRLRLKEGILLEEYFARFGVKLEVKFQNEIARLITLGLMRLEDGRLFLTEDGFRVSNSILLLFM